MAGSASVRLRAALERLDEAIDLLEARLAPWLENPPLAAPAGTGAEPATNAAIVARLDRIIERIELALTD